MRSHEGPVRRRGAVALYDSDRGDRMGELRSVFVPRSAYELECPQVFALGDRYYLTASVHDDRSQRYWVADGIDGPWRTPELDRLLPAGNYAARVFQWRGETGILGWYRDDRGHGALLSPMQLTLDASGNLVTRRWPAWDDRRGPVTSLPAPSAVWTDVQPQPRLDAPDGAGLWTWDDPGPNFELSLTLDVEAPRFGLSVGVDPQGGALSAMFDRGQARVRLLDERCRPDELGRPWFSAVEIQAGHYQPRARLQLRLRRFGNGIEVDVDGAVVLAATAPAHPGAVGVLVHGGSVTVLDAHVAELSVPEHR